MKVGKSIQKAIDDWEDGDSESAIMHACIAIDGTAKKAFPNLASNKIRFTKLLRDNYFILGPMGAPGIDLVNTRFPVQVKKPTTPDKKPDIADVIYEIHRCYHAHGDELPNGFELQRDAMNYCDGTTMVFEEGRARLSDRIIFGLCAVAVFSTHNKDQSVPEGYFLTFGKSAKLVINEWWGRAGDFHAISALEPMPSVKLDFADWMK
jgi:hypothetical protein